MLYKVVVWIESVEDDIGIGLMRGSEYNNLVQSCHISQELQTERTNFVGFSTMIEVHECLIQIQHKCILPVSRIISG